MPVPQIYVAFAVDTEDDHPNYVPGWTEYGSNYDLNPAVLNWSWTKYWHDLSECFVKNNVPVTWLIRVDDGPVHDAMLTQFKDRIFELKSGGDEIGIHIHTWHWNADLLKWVQTINSSDEIRIVNDSLEMFKRHLGFSPLSARMGWTAMSNEIMMTLESNGVIAEASATPGLISSGKFSNRDNIFDWSRTPTAPYHPSVNDYQSPGKMDILEMPISSLGSKNFGLFGKLTNKLSGKKSLFKLVNVAKWLRFNPHRSFYVTPWWSSSVYRRIIKRYGEKARKDGVSFLIGTFHPSDIFNPKSGAKNLIFEECIHDVLDAILALDSVKVNFMTLHEMAKTINLSSHLYFAG